MNYNLKKGHHNESTNQSLERRTTHETVNRNKSRNKPKPTLVLYSKTLIVLMDKIIKKERRSLK